MPGLDVMALDHDGCMGEIVILIVHGMPDLEKVDHYELLSSPLHQGSREDRCSALKEGLNWVMDLLEGEVNEDIFTEGKIKPDLENFLQGYGKIDCLVFVKSIKSMLDRINQPDVLFCSSNRQDALRDAGLAKSNNNGSCHELIDMMAEVVSERRTKPLLVNKSLVNMQVNYELRSRAKDGLYEGEVHESVKSGIEMLEKSGDNLKEKTWGQGHKFKFRNRRFYMDRNKIPRDIMQSSLDNPDDRVFKCLIMHNIMMRAREESPQGEIEVEFWDDRFTGNVHSFYRDNPELIPSGVVMKFMDCQPARGQTFDKSCQALTEISRLSLKYFQDVDVDTMKGEIGKFGAERRNEFFELLVQECHGDSFSRHVSRRKVTALLKDPKFTCKPTLADAWNKKIIEKPSGIEEGITNLASNITNDDDCEIGGPSL